MKSFTPELIARAKEAKSAEELLEIAKANGVELTAEEAKTYFEQLKANSAVSDDELDIVAGGSDGGCGNDEEQEEEKGTIIYNLSNMECPFCKAIIPRSTARYAKCPKCNKQLGNYA